MVNSLTNQSLVDSLKQQVQMRQVQMIEDSLAIGEAADWREVVMAEMI